MAPQMGDIGFVKMNGFIGRLVWLAQLINGDGRQNYQHCFIVVDNDHVVEAEPGGARLTPLSAYEGTNVVFYRMPGLTEGQRIDLAGIAQHLLGRPYSFLDYLAIALVRLHLPSKRLRRYVATTEHLICSQLCDYVYELGGIQIFTDNRLSGDVTPLDLYHQVRKLGWEEVS